MKYLKLYESFITEFKSLGEWIESLSDDDYVMNIVNRYVKDFDADIDLSNAINLLDDNKKADIKSQIEKYLDVGVEEKDPTVLTSTRVAGAVNDRGGMSNIYSVGKVGGRFVGESIEDGIKSDDELTLAGKGVFNSFLKSLTALGQKEAIPNYEKCPDDFLIFYYYHDLMSEDVKVVFNRFKSLLRYSGMIDYDKNEVSLYFGIKCDGNFEYGIYYDKLLPIGKFKLSKSAIKWLVQLDSKSSYSLKKELVNLKYTDILLFGKIKTEMKDFNPGYHEKRSYPMITDKVISFGYYGIGKWDNGKLDEGEMMNIKNNFTTWVISKKWGTKVLVSIKPQSFWLYIYIKLK